MSIQRSDQLNELFSALSKFQGKIEHAKKDKSGYLNRYKYADLTQYIEVAKEALEENGLCILQIPGNIEIVEITKEIEDKEKKLVNYHTVRLPKQTITTYIGHSSGQFISGPMEILVEKMAGNTWGQATGSAISFARRYAFGGTLCMTQEDDDNQIRKNDNVYHNKAQVQKDQAKDLPPPDPLVVQLMTLIKYSGCDITEFTKFHHISSSDLISVKKSIDNFDELLINFKNSQRVNVDNENKES